MATKIVLLGGRSYLIDADFDEVMAQYYPTTPASSALEARTNATYTQTNGNRVLVLPQSVTAIEENAEEDND